VGRRDPPHRCPARRLDADRVAADAPFRTSPTAIAIAVVIIISVSIAIAVTSATGIAVLIAAAIAIVAIMVSLVVRNCVHECCRASRHHVSPQQWRVREEIFARNDGRRRSVS
jgi:membrane protein YdbS with pleckstrin-like domain